MNLSISSSENSADPDKLASHEAIRSGSTLFSLHPLHWLESHNGTGWKTKLVVWFKSAIIIESWHGISNNVVYATSKASDQPVHTHSLIRTFPSRLNILWVLSYWLNIIQYGVSKLKRRLQRLVWVYTCQNATWLEITFVCLFWFFMSHQQSFS